MPTTDHGLPYPVLGDSANVPADLQALATATDAAFTTSVADETALLALSSPFDGQRVHLTSTNEVAYYDDGTATWQGYRKTYSMSVNNLPATVNSSTYVVQGSLVTVEFLITATGAATSDIQVSLPVPTDLANAQGMAGIINIVDNSSPSQRYACSPYPVTFGAGLIFNGTAVGSQSKLSSTFPFTWASGDTIGGVFTYFRG